MGFAILVRQHVYIEMGPSAELCPVTFVSSSIYIIVCSFINVHNCFCFHQLHPWFFFQMLQCCRMPLVPSSVQVPVDNIAELNSCNFHVLVSSFIKSHPRFFLQLPQGCPLPTSPTAVSIDAITKCPSFPCRARRHRTMKTSQQLYASSSLNSRVPLHELLIG